MGIKQELLLLVYGGARRGRGGEGGRRGGRAVRRGARAGPRGSIEGPSGARDPRVRARRPRRLHRRRAARRRPHRRDPQGVIPDKRLGQHFLTDRNILQRIADALEPAPDDVVVEIGAGKGSLTDELLARGLRVIAIEKDRRLAAELGTRKAERGTDRLTVVHGDALRLDWQAMVVPPSAFRVPHFKVIGHIPYAITSALIDRALTPPLP